MLFNLVYSAPFLSFLWRVPELINEFFILFPVYHVASEYGKWTKHTSTFDNYLLTNCANIIKTFIVNTVTKYITHITCNIVIGANASIINFIAQMNCYKKNLATPFHLTYACSKALSWRMLWHFYTATTTLLSILHKRNVCSIENKTSWHYIWHKIYTDVFICTVVKYCDTKQNNASLIKKCFTILYQKCEVLN